MRTSYVPGVLCSDVTAKPVLALPCGSKSTIRQDFPLIDNAVARLTAVVVFPTPPFWFTIENTVLIILFS